MIQPEAAEEGDILKILAPADDDTDDEVFVENVAGKNVNVDPELVPVVDVPAEPQPALSEPQPQPAPAEPQPQPAPLPPAILKRRRQRFLTTTGARKRRWD